MSGALLSHSHVLSPLSPHLWELSAACLQTRKPQLGEVKDFELGHAASTGPGVLGWRSQSLRFLAGASKTQQRLWNPHSIVIVLMQVEQFMQFCVAFFFPKLSIRYYWFHHDGGNGILQEH